MRFVMYLFLSLVVFSSAEASLSSLKLYGTPVAHILHKEGGHLSGPFVEVVRALFKEVGLPMPKIQMISVRRGKALLKENPNAVIFPFLTFPYREAIKSSPLAIGAFGAVKGSLIAKKSLLKARKVHVPPHLEKDPKAFKAFMNSFKYVLVNDGIAWSVLHSMGLKEDSVLGRVPTPEAAARVLGSGKVEVWPFVFSGAKRAFREVGLNPSDFTRLYSLRKAGELSIVMSPAAKGADVRALRMAFQKVKKNGTFARLMRKAS